MARGPYRKKASSRADHLPKPAKGTRTPGAGRKPGTPNKFTRNVKEAIIQAANTAGGKEGLAGFLVKQAEDNPRQFMGLLGRVLPLTIEGQVGVTLEALVLDAAKRREERDREAKQQS